MNLILLLKKNPQKLWNQLILPCSASHVRIVTRYMGYLDQDVKNLHYCHCLRKYRASVNKWLKQINFSPVPLAMFGPWKL